MKQFLFILGISISWTCRAQDIVELAHWPLPFVAIIHSVYADTNGFVAKATVEIQSPPKKPLALPVTIQGYGTKISASALLSDAAFLPDQLRQQLRSFSLNEFCAIADFSTKQTAVLFPGIKGYVEGQAPRAVESILKTTGDRNRFQGAFLGKESYQGFECQKIQLNEIGDTNATIFAWERLGLKNFPVKIELLRSDVTMSVKVHSVELVRPPINTLEAPEGFVRYASFPEIIKTANRLTPINGAGPANVSEGNK